MTEEYTNFDLGFSSTVQTRKALPIEHERCPYHEKLQKQKELTTKKPVKKTALFETIVGRWTFKSNLEEKLKTLGIKAKVKLHNKRKIQPCNGKEKDESDKLTLTEVKLLTPIQQEMVIKAFQSKISQLNDELKELTEENERLADDKEGLKLTVRNLEELSLRVMKPWVNAVPESDELTRVMLLN